MRRQLYPITLALTLVLCECLFAGSPEFTSIGSAEMLVITHDDLRTPNWSPGMEGAWETILLEQKESQGITVGLLDIPDGMSPSEIRAIIEDSAGTGLEYVYIIGDADRWEDEAGNPQWLESDADSNRLVPFYWQDVDPNALNCSHYPLENDLGYIDGITGLEDVSVGRLPAESRDEILTYLGKSGDYINLATPAWAKKQLLAFDDNNHPWVACSGGEFRSWAYQLADEVPANWTTRTLLTSNYGNYYRHRIIESIVLAHEVNDSFGLIFSLGVASHTNNLNYFMFGRSYYGDFSNDGVYPLLLGFNCSIGAIQRPDSCTWDTTTQSCSEIFWDYNVVEKLLFLDHAGIIGAIAPTQWTICDVCRYQAKKAQDFLIDDNVHIFGKLWQRMVSLRDTSESATLFPVGDWHYENLVLLGDPTLRYPLSFEATGHWTISMSPVTILDTVHVPSGDSLIIDAGVHVLFDAGAALVVDADAKLIVNGESGDTVVFDAKDSGESWKGIFVNGGQLDMEYAAFYHTSNAAVYTESPDGANTPVIIDHCYLRGDTNGTILLRLWGSPSKTQVVSNTLVEEAGPTSNGMYLFNCNVDFDNVIVRNCPYVNSYIKKVTGSFRNCTFEGRITSGMYSILVNVATCTPNFKCCEFKNLSPTSGTRIGTVFCGGGTAPTFGGVGYNYGVSNVFEDTSNYLLVIQGTGVLPVINYTGGMSAGPGGRNDWYQYKSTGKFIEWRDAGSGSTVYNAENQYWNLTPVDSLFYPSGRFDYDPRSTTAWGLCGGEEEEPGGNEVVSPPPGNRSSGTLDDLENGEADSLAIAIYLESEGEFSEAQRICHNVAATATDPMYRWLAIVHGVTTDVMLGNTADWIPGLIDSLKNAENSYSARVSAGRIMSSYRLNRQEYSAAIDTCMSLLSSGLTFSDSILVAVDLIGIQMSAGLRDLGGSHLDNAGTTSIPARLRVMSDKHGLRLENELLGLLEPQGDVEASALIPTQYRLHQNYPNPFNPNTEIKFDLPEAVKVQIKIFNTLGQEVATLIDEVRPAGAHRIMWDSKSASGVQVASGVYVYQIKAGKFVDSKKMVLIR